MPHEHLKFLGLLSVAVAVAAGAVLLRTWPKGKGFSISEHAGAQRRSYYLFLTVLIGDGFLFFLFMWRWFVPALRLPLGYMLLVLVGYLLQVATAVIPHRGDHGRLARLHGLVAFSMAGIMAVLTGLLALTSHVSAFGRMVAAATFGFMTLFWYLFVFVKSTRRHFLVYQAAYIASFYVCILAVSYL
ncbi:MAG TPA: hypothetical protein VF466_03435 [Candidatus Saccharimonadales bacterium]